LKFLEWKKFRNYFSSFFESQQDLKEQSPSMSLIL